MDGAASNLEVIEHLDPHRWVGDQVGIPLNLVADQCETLFEGVSWLIQGDLSSGGLPCLRLC